MKTFHLLLFVIFGASLLNAQVINVPNDQSSIQAAIEAAAEGDTIIVEEGLYYENINFLGKAITLASHFILDGDTAHISKTIIDGSQATHPDSASVVLMISGEDTTSVLMGFTITGGKGSKHSMKWGSASYPGLWGGGIVINNSGGLISHNTIESNNLGPSTSLDEIYGGGLTAIVNNNHSLIIRNNTFRNNSVTGYYAYGGGAFLAGGRIIFEKNIVSENTCFASDQLGASGVFWANYGNAGVINEVLFSGNMITENKGYCEKHTGISGALSISLTIGDEAVRVENNVIANNYSDASGGGLYLFKTKATVFNNTIWNNESTRSGNSVELIGPSNIVMFNNIIWSNAENNVSEFTFMEFGTSTFDAWFNILKEPFSNNKITALGNSFLEPVFLPESYDLAENSPGIGWGTDSLLINELWYKAPIIDLYGENRVAVSMDENIDMGAIESPFNRPYNAPESDRCHIVPVEQASIQAGIDVALDGDTVLVLGGIYYENINFMGKAITVSSEYILGMDEGHITRTIIDGSQANNPDRASTVLMISGEDTTSVLTGFTITGGKGSKLAMKWGSSSYAGLWGGGIAINNSGGLISHNIIENNNLGDRADLEEIIGGGLTAIVNNNHSLIVRNNTIRTNSISGLYAGGGGAFLAGGRIIFENNIVSENTCFASQQLGTSGVFWANYGNAGVINEVVIRNNLIAENKGYSETNNGLCGALGISFTIGEEAVQVYNNVIADNYLEGNGGGLYLYKTRATVFNNTILNNTSKTSGNSVELVGPSNVVMINNIIRSNARNNYAEFAFKDFGSSTFDLWFNLLEAPVLYSKVNSRGNSLQKPDFISGSFDLAKNSPGIGAGVDSLFINELWYHAPLLDFHGKNRAFESADQRIDAGAVESPYDRPPIPNTGDIIIVPDEQASIQAAIDAAEDGNTVLVREGIYYENINFNGKAITVASEYSQDMQEGHIARTVIDGSQAANPDTASVVTLWSGEDTTSILTGFTIMGGSGTKFTNSGETINVGGGIYTLGAGGLFSNNLIEENHIGDKSSGNNAAGGGLSCLRTEYHPLIIRNNTIKNNSISGKDAYGGGIYVDGINAVIDNNNIFNNEVLADNFSTGGGISWSHNISASNSGDFEIKNNTLTANLIKSDQDAEFGSAIDIYRGIKDDVVKIYNNIITDHHNNNVGGGIFATNETNDLIIYNNTLVNNLAKNFGNSIGLETSHNNGIVLFNNILWSGSLKENEEIFIWYNYSPVVVYNNLMTQALSEDYTGAIAQGNIFERPEFSNDSYEFADSRYGIGQGIESVEIEGTVYHAPPYDINGNLRPHPIDNYIDIGAAESPYPFIVGIEGISNLAFKVYPNPSNGLLSIETEFPDHYSITISSIKGQQILSTEMQGNTAQVDLSEFAEGVYFLTIRSKAFVETRKIIKLMD